MDTVDAIHSHELPAPSGATEAPPPAENPGAGLRHGVKIFHRLLLAAAVGAWLTSEHEA